VTAALLALGLTLGAGAPQSVLAADGVAIRYDVRGQGAPAVVLVHCWTCDRRFWDAAAQRLAARQTVVTLDLAGHGESGRDRRVWSIPAFGGDVRAVVEALGLQRVVLVGHSMGGPVILEAAALLGRRVAGLVPVDAFVNVEQKLASEQREAFLSGFRTDYPAAAERFLRGYMFGPATPAAVVERIVRGTTTFAPEVAVACLEQSLAYDAAASLARVEVPITAINSDRYPTDLAANRRHAFQFELRLMEGVGHYPMLEAPERFAELLERVVGEMAGAVP
jgi:pimeloyl-ACP methyl ester carboxylesterase